MTTKLVNIRLEDREIAMLDKLAGKALNRQAVARMLLIAAIEAIEENQGKLDFPPRLTVLAEEPVTYRINDKKTKSESRIKT